MSQFTSSNYYDSDIFKYFPDSENNHISSTIPNNKCQHEIQLSARITQSPSTFANDTYQPQCSINELEQKDALESNYSHHFNQDRVTSLQFQLPQQNTVKDTYDFRRNEVSQTFLNQMYPENKLFPLGDDYNTPKGRGCFYEYNANNVHSPPQQIYEAMNSPYFRTHEDLPPFIDGSYNAHPNEMIPEYRRDEFYPFSGVGNASSSSLYQPQQLNERNDLYLPENNFYDRNPNQELISYKGDTPKSNKNVKHWIVETKDWNELWNLCIKYPFIDYRHGRLCIDFEGFNQLKRRDVTIFYILCKSALNLNTHHVTDIKEERIKYKKRDCKRRNCQSWSSYKKRYPKKNVLQVREKQN